MKKVCWPGPFLSQRGATITLSNFALRRQWHWWSCRQVATVGSGALAAVVAIHGLPAVRRRLPLSLTFDHRAVTGGEAARFLGAMLTDLQRKD
jgi:pyruvate dehydrogenase E2 component (dihydrolipoamide acetyltransferase)